MRAYRFIPLLFFSWSLMGFANSDRKEQKDRVEVLTLYVAAETSTYIPWYSDQPIVCLLVQEKGESEYKKLDMGSIAGFTHEEGCSYTLKVKKITLSNPPADASSVTYQLLDIRKRTPSTEK